MSKDSEIFDNYFKIALEKGIISKAEKDPKKVLENNPRASYQNPSDIEALYNIKPSKPKSMEYKNNIMEVAHPNSVILAPSYDKINGLVENNNERQKVILNIVNKPSNGHLTQKKYAESELVHSLIRIGNDMDNRNIDELRILADVCAAQLKKRADWMDKIKDFFKERTSDATDVGGGAVGGATIGGTIGGILGVLGGPFAEITIPGGIWAGAQLGALVGGLTSAIAKTSPQAKGVANNAHMAMKQLSDIIKYKPNDSFLLKLNEELNDLATSANEYASAVDQMHNSTSDGDKQNAAKISSLYMTKLIRMKGLIAQFKQNADAGNYAPEESDVWSKIKSPFSAMFGTDVHDEEVALDTLERVIEHAIDGVLNTQKEAGALKEKVESAKNLSFKPVSQTKKQQNTSNNDEDIEEFNRQFSNIPVEFK